MPCSDTALRVMVTVWLVVMSALDLRRRELPHRGTTVPLLVLGLAAVASATSALTGLDVEPLVGSRRDDCALCLAFLSVLLSDHRLALVPAAAGLTVTFAGGSGQGQAAVTGWLVSLGLAKAGIVGEGDAKVVMVLLALCPDPSLAVCLLITAGLTGLVVLLRRARRATLVVLAETLRAGLKGRFPVRAGERAVAVIPLTPVLAVGALAYLWPLWSLLH